MLDDGYQNWAENENRDGRVENRLTASNSEHAKIIERMLDGDPEGAEEAMRRHIASAKMIASLVNKIDL